MNTEIMPSTIAPPAANYAHAVLSTNAARLLHVSGQVAARLDGTIPDAVADQAEVIWSNIAAILAEAGMQMNDIVSITTYVVVDHMADLPKVMAARDAAMAGHRAASTLVAVPALARPAWKMEVAIVAAAGEG
jgi:2-iminobutanoate/2-iminopropanoate deaminase